jgi:hypothetical protein
MVSGDIIALMDRLSKEYGRKIFWLRLPAVSDAFNIII